MKVKRLLPFLLLVLGFLGAASSSMAATLFVTSSGNNSRTYAQAQHPDSSLLTVAQAITLANNGDVIMVGAGTYSAALTINKRITIIGAGNESSGTIFTGGVTFSAALSGVLRQELRNVRLTGTTGITVTTGKVSLYNVTTTGAATAFNITATSNDLEIINSAFVSGTSGISVPNEVGVDGFVIRNSQIRRMSSTAISFAQTTVPATANVNNFTMTNCAVDENQTTNGANQQVLQIQKLSNATITNCTFSRIGTGVSNLVNLAMVGGNYSNITFRDCRFMVNTVETSGQEKRGIYVQPVLANATLSNVTIERCEFTQRDINTASGAKLSAGVNLQNQLSGTIRVRHNSFPQVDRVGVGLQVFGGTASYGSVDGTYNYFNALGAGKVGKYIYTPSSTTSGNSTVAITGVTSGNNPLGLTGSSNPSRWTASGGLFSISSVNVGAGTMVTSPAPNSTGATTLTFFNSGQIEAGQQMASLTLINTDLDITNPVTTTLGTNYHTPVYLFNSDGTVAGTYSTLTAAMAAASGTQTIGNLAAYDVAFSSAEPTITIPASSTITLTAPGGGSRYIQAALTRLHNVTIPVGSTLKLGSDLAVQGTLTINGSLDLNGFNLVLQGSSAVAGTGSITDATGYGNIVLRGSSRSLGTFNFSSANMAGFIDSLGTAGTYSWAGTFSFSKNGYVHLVSSPTATSASVSNGGYAFQGAGSVNYGSTGDYAATSETPVGIANSSNVGDLTIDGAGGAYLLNNTQVNGALTLTSGTLHNYNRTLTIAGTVSTTSGSLALYRQGSLSKAGSASVTLPATAGAVNGLGVSDGTLRLGATLTTYGTVTLSGGVLHLNGQRLNLNHTSSFSTSLGTLGGNSTSTLYVSGPVSGAAGSAGTVVFTSAPDNAIGTLWLRRGLTLSSELNIFNRLRVANGTFAAGGNQVTFRSNASGTASLDTVGPSPAVASITGFNNVTVQRWYGTTARWMLVAAPIPGQTLNNWVTSSPGTNGINFTFNSGPGQQPSVWTFSNGGSWSAGTVSTLSQTFGLGRGLRIYARTPFLTVNDGINNAGPGVMYWTGSPQVGNFTFSGLVSSGNGWNLVGNPFAAPLDWEAESNWTRTNVANTMMYWGTDGYRGLIKVGLSYVSYNSGTGVIPSGQGFFVQGTSGTPSLVANETAKTTPTASFYRTGSASVMRGTLRNAAGNSDEIILSFNDSFGYTNNNDRGLDAPKMVNQVLNIATFSADNVQLTADLRPVPTRRDSIRLRVQGNASGAYTLTFTDLEAGSWYLRDKKLNTLTDLSVNPSYAFNITLTDTTSFGNNRFELVVQPRVTNLNTTAGRAHVLAYPNPAKASEVHLALNGLSAQSSLTISFIDAMGREVAAQNLSTTTGTEHVAVPTQLANGIYTLRVVNGKDVFTQKIIINN